MTPKMIAIANNLKPLLSSLGVYDGGSLDVAVAITAKAIEAIYENWDGIKAEVDAMKAGEQHEANQAAVADLCGDASETWRDRKPLL